ncbi:hypothetical protein FDP41_006579 [Naegleria fowleri]|uniref:F-box domain-containing protein n=1 Tax=Naegleria fowleri TaxID=5763 RepID=A0A6A5BBS3_NAEFO|nr:uncharacterized protein FDP41_006579 [Naegleria fowleri]KAF0974547.1 hypothetical protein FDP41_006579 [Naegleria fowleri]CAG4708217.1 unnamed protein product [Naegleria fowleri]
MFAHDDLLSIFMFLDFSHVPKLSLVCNDWYKIVSSNALWEWYFHLMSNNKKGKTSIETKVLEKDDVFWRNMIRDHFSNYKLRASNCISSHETHDLSKEMAFLNHSSVHPFLRQFAKFICGRIKIEKIYFSGDGELKMKSFSLENVDQKFDKYQKIFEMKIKMRISGIDECIIARTKYSAAISIFGYWYCVGAFVYFSTESHDRIHEHVQHPSSPSIDHERLSDMHDLQNCFLYVFNGREQSPTLKGEQYLEDHVLSKCVPTLSQFNLSPRSAIPLLCYIVTCVSGADFFYYGHRKKEFTHAYPDIANNTFMYYQKYAKYIGRVQNEISTLRQIILSSPLNVNPNICTTVNRMIEGKISVIEPLKSNERDEYWNCLQSKVVTSKQKAKYFPGLFTHRKSGSVVSTNVSGDVIMEEILSFQKALKVLENENEVFDSYLRHKSSKFKQ